MNYGPSLQDQGIGPDDWLEPEQPRCRCGAFLPWMPEEIHVLAGYPGEEFDDIRERRTCTRCGRHSYEAVI